MRNISILHEIPDLQTDDTSFESLYDLDYHFRELFLLHNRWKMFSAVDLSDFKLKMIQLTTEQTYQIAKTSLNKEIEFLVVNKKSLTEWKRVAKAIDLYWRMGSKPIKPSRWTRLKLWCVFWFNRSGYNFFSYDNAMQTEKFMYEGCLSAVKDREAA